MPPIVPTETITIELKQADLNAIRSIAGMKGTTPERLISEMVMNSLRDVRGPETGISEEEIVETGRSEGHGPIDSV